MNNRMECRLCIAYLCFVKDFIYSRGEEKRESTLSAPLFNFLLFDLSGLWEEKVNAPVMLFAVSGTGAMDVTMSIEGSRPACKFPIAWDETGKLLVLVQLE